MLRFVFDTNVIVSSLLFAQSTPRQAVNRALDTGKIVISQEIIGELTQVLSRKKLNKYLLEQERIKFLADFLKETETVTINQTFEVCRDKKDNKSGLTQTPQINTTCRGNPSVVAVLNSTEESRQIMS
jgi:putative PIN family toxin of toxin-antitoxin system